MHSLYKNMTGGGLDYDSDVRVINTNERVEARLQEILGEEMPQAVNEYEEEEFGYEEESEYGEEGAEGEYDPEFQEGIESLADGLDIDEIATQRLAQASEEAQDILAAAQEQAESLLAQAGQEASELKEEAKEEGYREGVASAQEDMRVQQEDFEIEKSAWEQDKRIQQASMEYELVDKILKIVDKVFRVTLSDYKGMILQMVTDAISGIDGAKSFAIKVAPENLDFMETMLSSLQKKVGSGVTIEVSADSGLTAEQCMLETETGLFDCSPFKEFENLAQSIRVLAAPDLDEE